MSLGDYGSDLSRYLPDAATLVRNEYDTVLDDLNSEINSKVESSAKSD